MEGEPEPDESIPSLVSRLIDDGEQFVRAELKLYRARAFSRLDEVRNAILFGVGSLVLAQAVLVAGLVGFLLILQPYVGTALATLIMVVTGVAIAILMAFMAYRLIKRATDIKDKDDRP